MNTIELIENINRIDKQFHTNIIKLYSQIENKREDLVKSLSSEIKCFMILEQLFEISEVTHDSQREIVREKTPDWILSLDGTKTMIEVYNQNISKVNLGTKLKAKIGEFNLLTIDEDRLSKGSLTKKYTKYIPQIKKLNIPYFLFIDVDFLGDLDEISLRKFLYGPQIEDLSTSPASVYTIYHDGFYYANNSNGSKFINGFFLLKDGKTSYFHNYNSKNSISETLKLKLMQLQQVNY